MTSTSVAQRDPVVRPAFSPLCGEEHVELFLLLSRLRGAGHEALHRLFFAPRLGLSLRATLRRLAFLVRGGFLGRVEITTGRSVYFLGRAALSTSPTLGATAPRTLCKRPPWPQAHYCWMRSALHALLHEDGYTIGRDARAVLALRRFLIDGTKASSRDGWRSRDRALERIRAMKELAPPSIGTCDDCGLSVGVDEDASRCPRCPRALRRRLAAEVYRCLCCARLVTAVGAHRTARDTPCDGPLRRHDLLAFDVAWRARATTRGATYDVMVLVLDEPRRALVAQLRELPLTVEGAIRVPVVLRTSDPQSVLDVAKNTFRSIGLRHLLLNRAFIGPGLRDLYPFSETTTVVSLGPGIEMWRS